MRKCILAGCDLHDRSLCIAASLGRGSAHKQTFENSPHGRERLLKWLRDLAPRAQVVFAYEASGLGFGLYDAFTAAGIRCHVLAPSKLGTSPQQRKNKTDEKDALKILDVLRAHYLAGATLPEIWIPDELTRDGREMVRARLDAQNKCTRIKTQIRTLLKRTGVARPEGGGWNNSSRKSKFLAGISSNWRRRGATKNRRKRLRIWPEWGS